MPALQQVRECNIHFFCNVTVCNIEVVKCMLMVTVSDMKSLHDRLMGLDSMNQSAHAHIILTKKKFLIFGIYNRKLLQFF